jgi:DNA-binding NtrC family response regulator
VELAEFFLNKYNREFGKRLKEIEAPAMRALQEYTWPGNIRQLESVIERAVIMSDTESIKLRDIKGELSTSHPAGHGDFEIPDEGIDLDEFEGELLRQAMKKANGVVARAAKLLGMSYKTFWYRWEKLQPENPLRRKDSQEQ